MIHLWTCYYLIWVSTWGLKWLHVTFHEWCGSTPYGGPNCYLVQKHPIVFLRYNGQAKSLKKMLCNLLITKIMCLNKPGHNNHMQPCGHFKCLTMLPPNTHPSISLIGKSLSCTLNSGKVTPSLVLSMKLKNTWRLMHIVFPRIDKCIVSLGVATRSRTKTWRKVVFSSCFLPKDL